MKTKTLREIIHELGDKSYNVIDVRTVVKMYKGARKKYEILAGCCSYDSATQELHSLDGDDYYLDDSYYKWEESSDDDGIYLDVWYESEYLDG